MPVGRFPSVHSLLANRRDNIRHKLKIVVERYYNVVGGKLHNAEIHRIEDIGQIRFTREQSRRDSRAVTVCFVPINRDVRARETLDCGEIIAPVKAIRSAVKRNAEPRYLQAVLEEQVLAFGQGFRALEQLFVHSLNAEASLVGGTR